MANGMPIVKNPVGDVQWDVKWIGGLLALLGAYLLLNTMILSASPPRIIYHDLVISVILVVCAKMYGCGKGQSILPWVFFVLGAYLLISPVLLWAPEGVQFLNHTIVGILTASLGGLVPFARADALHAAPLKPQGWSYNPSVWSQRFLVFVFCVCCWAIASYMAAYQLGYISQIWDPVFGHEGTLQVITSALSRSFPVSDAGLGAALYGIEALCVWKGGLARWYTSPAFVLFFGVLVIPVGCVSTLLIISQPIVVGHWCFWCLFTAVCMLCMIALAIDEVYAAIQFLVRTRQVDPHDFWRTFWHGGRPYQMAVVYESVGLQKSENVEKETWKGLIKGVSLTIPLVLSMLIGVWLMASPTFRATMDRIGFLEDTIGPLIIAVSVIATAEVARPIRYVNLAFGILLCLTLFFIDTSWYEWVEVLVAGVLLIMLSLPRGNHASNL